MGSSSRIFEYFVVCGLGPEIRSLDGIKGFHGVEEMYMSAFLDQFPPSNHALYPPPPPQLPTCVLPAGVRIYSSGLDTDDVSTYPRSYPIVLTEGDGSKIYVSCIAFRDPICEDIIEAYQIPANSFADKCICLVSHSPSFQVLRDALEEIFVLCFSPAGCSKPLWDIISHMVSHVTLPTPGKNRVLFAIENCLLSAEAPPKEWLPHADISFQPLVQCLDVDKLILLFTAVLLERRILLRSNKYTLLTLVSEAICHLIYPIRWQHVYIPIIFSSGVDYIDAPTPYMMGLHSGVDTSAVTMDGVVVVDLEYNRITTTEEIPPIPETEHSFLRGEILKLLQPNVMGIDFMKINLANMGDRSLRAGTKSWSQEHDFQLRLIFLRFFAQILSGYRNFIDTTSTTGFNSQAFLKKRSRATNQPVESMSMIMQFLETQGFLDYLERCNSAEENAHNLLDKLQDATGRGQNPLIIFPSQVADPEIITIANPEIEGSEPDNRHCYKRFPANARTEEQEEKRKSILALASGASKQVPSSPSIRVNGGPKAESLSPRERAAERERMVLDIKVKLQGLWLRLLRLGATEDPLSSFEYGTILALIESDAEGIGGSGFVECIREHIHSGWQCRLTDEQFIAVKELLKMAITLANSRNDLATIRDALEVSAEMYRKDPNNVQDYVQRHLLSLSVWEELRNVPDAASSSSGGLDMARPPKRPLRGGAGRAGAVGRGRLSSSSGAGDGVATRGVDEHPPLVDGDDLAPHTDDELEAEAEDDDDMRDDAAGLFGIDLGDANVGSQPETIEIDGDDEGGVAASTGATSTTSGAGTGKKSDVWGYFHEIKEGKTRVAAICKHCRSRYTARSAAGTGHLRRHMKSCMSKRNAASMVQSRLALNHDGLKNWVYDPMVARIELCRLIARLDLPLGVGETQAWEDYIKRAHNPLFEKVSRQTTTRDVAKLFGEQRDMLMKSLLPAASSVSLTSDIWSGNAKEDYISVVAHYVSADWEIQKKVIGFRLIEVKHTGENIADKIARVVEEFGLSDKVFAVTLDNASSNSKAHEILQPILFGYLGSYPAPTRDEPTKVKYLLVHQRCACHIINLIVKSGLKRLKPYTDDVRTAINFLNSSNQRIALFKNYCIAQGLRPRKFGLDMDVRWNSTYLMLKHLLPYKEVFSVFINSNYGTELLTPQHWYVAEQIMVFLELFYDCTVTLSGVYYPTSPLVLHHILELAEHLQKAERDQNFRNIATPMKLKLLKYWEKIPLIYSYAFILDPRAKMKGFFNVLELLGKALDVSYNLYYGDVKDELTRLFGKYQQKFGGAASFQRPVQPPSCSGKRKQAWGRIFGGPGASPGCSPSATSTPSAVSELTAYLDSDPVTCYDPNFDILLWWRDHKLTYPILSILARDIMSVPVSTVSSESCFSLSARILEDRRRRLLPEHVEMLTCIKDWELGARREQHSVEDTDLEEAFKNLFLDELGGEGSATGSATGSGTGAG